MVEVTTTTPDEGDEKELNTQNDDDLDNDDDGEGGDRDPSDAEDKYKDLSPEQLKAELNKKDQKIEKMKGREKRNYNKVQDLKKTGAMSEDDVKEIVSKQQKESAERASLVERYGDELLADAEAIAKDHNIPLEDAYHVAHGRKMKDPAYAAKERTKISKIHGQYGTPWGTQSLADAVFSKSPFTEKKSDKDKK